MKNVEAGMSIPDPEQGIPDPEQRIPNPEQQRVIDDLDHNIILFASAGTGKTFTVARRVQAIIAAGRAEPSEILCLTFTIRAAGEMRNDILAYAGEKAKEVAVSTIHAFAFQMLKEEYVRRPEYYTLPGVCDEDEASEIANRVMLEMGLPAEADVLDRPSMVRDLIGFMKHRREQMNAYGRDEAEDFHRVYLSAMRECPGQVRKIISFYSYQQRQDTVDTVFERFLQSHAGDFLQRYCLALRQSNLLDFNDLICQTHRLLQGEEARQYWRARYRYIIIDEMQDTSELEYDMLRQLFPGNRIMMCGDFFQTIYQWRGSNPERVLEAYSRDYQAVHYMFSRNYRSTRTLTRASFGYLRNTWPRLMGKFCPPEVMIESREAGEPILNIRPADQEKAAAYIYDYLLRNRPDHPAKVCLMCRFNSAIGKLYDQLVEISMAQRSEADRLRFFTVEKGMKLFRKPVIRDMLAYFRVLVNPTDAQAVRRLTERYVKRVGEQTISRIEEKGELGISLVSFMDPDLYRFGDPYETLIEAWRQGNVVVYDTETTGLNLEKDQAYQISAIRLGPDGTVTEALDQLMIPTREICAAARAVHHQTLESIRARGGGDMREGMEKFLRFCRGAVLVGHNNLRFDSPLISRMLRELGLPQPDIVAEYDTLVLAHQLLPKSVNHQLGTLCAQFGIVNEAAHDAMGDIGATGRLLSHFLEHMIIPQREDRRQVLAEFRPRFESLYKFIQQLRTEYLQRNDISGLAHRVAEICQARSDNREANAQFALDDVLYTIDQAEYGDGTEYLRGMIRDAALSGSQIDVLLEKMKKIPIITVHQSKGCEFDTVIIADADDSSYPSYMALRENREEEEKRVFYVAISRAKRKLILVSSKTVTTKYGTVLQNPQSRFIQQIPKDCIVTGDGSV